MNFIKFIFNCFSIGRGWRRRHGGGGFGGGYGGGFGGPG